MRRFVTHSPHDGNLFAPPASRCRCAHPFQRFRPPVGASRGPPGDASVRHDACDLPRARAQKTPETSEEATMLRNSLILAVTLLTVPAVTAAQQGPPDRGGAADERTEATPDGSGTACTVSPESDRSARDRADSGGEQAAEARPTLQRRDETRRGEASGGGRDRMPPQARAAVGGGAGSRGPGAGARGGGRPDCPGRSCEARGGAGRSGGMGARNAENAEGRRGAPEATGERCTEGRRPGPS